jgi:hypothetical protein
MKKSFLLIVLCVFVCLGAYAQKSDVEVASQLTKVEQFKTKNSFIKETEIYKVKGDVKVYCKLFTDLKTDEKIAALEFVPSTAKLLLGTATTATLGYLDMDEVDDFVLALETIVNEFEKRDKKEQWTISYSAPGGIDVIAGPALPLLPANFVLFRKKWFKIDEYGQQTCVYSEGNVSTSINKLPEIIAGIKEAQQIANQALSK